MAKCKEHEWKIIEGFSVCMRAVRKYGCAKCGAVKYTVIEGSSESEITAGQFNDFWKEYLSDR